MAGVAVSYGPTIQLLRAPLSLPSTAAHIAQQYDHPSSHVGEQQFSRLTVGCEGGRLFSQNCQSRRNTHVYSI